MSKQNQKALGQAGAQHSNARKSEKEQFKDKVLESLFFLAAEAVTIFAFLAVVVMAVLASEALLWVAGFWPASAPALMGVAKAVKWVLFVLALLGLLKSTWKHLVGKGH